MTRIHIIGDIDEGQFSSFDFQMASAEANKETDVVVIISSAGGCGIDALAFHDRIKASPCNVHILVYGEASSAAALVLSAGDTRRMAKNSWCLLHEDTTDIKKDMRVTKAKRDLAQAERFERQWCELLAENTTTKAESWALLHRRETYLTAQECLEKGLIDGII